MVSRTEDHVKKLTNPLLGQEQVSGSVFLKNTMKYVVFFDIIYVAAMGWFAKNDRPGEKEERQFLQLCV